MSVIFQPFDAVVTAASVAPEAVAVSTPDTEMTFAELLDGARRVAGLLRQAGVAPGDVVAFRVPQLMEPVVTLACFHEAAIGTVLPPGYDHARSPLIDWFVGGGQVPGVPKDRHISLDEAAMERMARMEPNENARPYPAPDSVCHIVFSSGTTGQAKPISISVDTLHDRCVDRREQWMLARPYFCQMGFSTMMGFHTFMASLIVGDVFLTARQGKDALEAIRRNSVACSVASPHQWGVLLQAASRGKVPVESLTTTVSVGAILPDFLAGQLARKFGVEIAVMYAASECGSISLRRGTDSAEGYTGTLVSGAHVRIVGPDGNTVSEGDVGEIAVQRSRQPQAYFGEETSPQAWRDGYFFPGDSGFLRGDRLYLTGRTSELINAAGTKIDPARVDAIALEFEGVTDAAVFGFIDSQGLTTVALVFTSEAAIDVNSFTSFLGSRLGDSSPRRLARVSDIPRTTSGKVNRELIAEMYRKVNPDTTVL